MKTNISCIIRRKLLLGVPLTTNTISLSLSFSVVANVATGNTQLASSDICYVNFL